MRRVTLACPRPLQPMERVGSHGGLRQDDEGTGLGRFRTEDRHDGRDLPEGAAHGFRPAGEKGGPNDQRGRLIARMTGGRNTRSHAVTDATGRPLKVFMTAVRVGYGTGAAALPNRSPAAEWMLADRGDDADWLREALKDQGIGPCIPARTSRGKAVRSDRCATTFLAAAALAAAVRFRLCRSVSPEPKSPRKLSDSPGRSSVERVPRILDGQCTRCRT